MFLPGIAAHSVALSFCWYPTRHAIQSVEGSLPVKHCVQLVKGSLPCGHCEEFPLVAAVLSVVIAEPEASVKALVLASETKSNSINTAATTQWIKWLVAIVHLSACDCVQFAWGTGQVILAIIIFTTIAYKSRRSNSEVEIIWSMHEVIARGEAECNLAISH